MDFESSLEYIYSHSRFAKSPGLERIRALLFLLGSPEKKLRYVHVLGTNGKGSTSTMISCALQRSGYKTGLFTSPFVTEFRERIQIDGEYIKKDAFCKYTNEIKKACVRLEQDGLYPTFFEVVLALALCCFASEQCDIVVLEAGIGGRDDSTNVIPAPIVTVFTSISLDHIDVLGSTVEEIAENKFGAIKSGTAVVSFPNNNCSFDFVPQKQSVCTLLQSICREKNCELIYPDMTKLNVISEDLFKTNLSYDGLQFSISLIGEHQKANAATAVCVLRALQSVGFSISDETIEKGLSDAFIPARMEVVSSKPMIILDGGHNEGCAKALSEAISRHISDRKIIGLMAFMEDKDYKSALELLAPMYDSIVFTLADKKRGEEPQRLAECASGYGCDCLCEKEIAKALERAMGLLNDNSALVVCGSFYLVSEVRRILLNNDKEC